MTSEISNSATEGESPAPAGAETAARAQYAALCWRQSGASPEVLLITSRDTGRWILPKGWPMKNRSPSEAAAVEAWEEAGVKGAPDVAPLGQYRYDKILRSSVAQPCEVQVFSLMVEDLARDFPEKKQRRRKWFSPETAARKVAEPELRNLILAFGAANAGAEAPSGKKAAPGKKGR